MPPVGLRAWWREHRRDPVFWTEVIQIAKTVVAAVLAWVVATSVLHLPQSFLAPWAALLVVHATVYRTFSQGARQVAATLLGVLLAWAVGNALGSDPLAVGAVLLLGLTLGAVPWLRSEATTAAATGLVVLTTGFADQDALLLSRLADTSVGIGVGLVVNLIVWPPLRRRTAERAIESLDDRIGELLVDMGDGLALGVTADDVEAWVSRTHRIDEDVDRAWAMVRQARESAQLNPRRGAAAMRDPKQWIAMLESIEAALADCGSMARTLLVGVTAEETWQAEFRDVFVEVLRASGRAIAEADREAVRRCREDLDELVVVVDRESSTPRLWPVYGGLIINLRNILDALDDDAVMT